MNGADWIIIAAIAVSIAMAASQGFFFEMISVAGVVLGYLLASWQYPYLGDWLGSYVKSVWIGEVTGFFVIFLLVVIAAGVIARLSRWAMKEAGLSWFDRLLGAVFGVLRGGLMVAVLLVGLTSFVPASRWLTGSELAPYFLVVGRAAIWVAPSELRARFYQGLDILRNARQPRQGAPAAKSGTH
jgi:membrane protein required for colicin V production